MLAYLLCLVCLLCARDIGAQEDSAQLISVDYTIYNDLIEEPFKYSIVVSVKEGSTLLQVMQKAAELNPKHFSCMLQLIIALVHNYDLSSRTCSHDSNGMWPEKHTYTAFLLMSGSFQTETSSWGAYVTSINNLGGSTNDKTYWQFFNDVTPLNEGVGTYKPKNKEHILAIFSKY